MKRWLLLAGIVAAGHCFPPSNAAAQGLLVELELAGRRIETNPVAVEFSADSGLELLWDRPFPNAPAPWEAVPGAWAWRLLYDPDAPVPSADRPALIAGLVTVGQRNGRQ